MTRWSKEVKKLAWKVHHYRHVWHASDYDGGDYPVLEESIKRLEKASGMRCPQLRSFSTVDLQEWNLEVRSWVKQFIPNKVIEI